MGCQATTSRTDGRLRIVATTTIVADLARQLGGEAVAVTALMGPGIDPHLYRASEGDVARMQQADLVLYNGLHLEGKMTEVFERMQALGRPTLAVAECVPTACDCAPPASGASTTRTCGWTYAAGNMRRVAWPKRWPAWTRHGLHSTGTGSPPICRTGQH
ncbi:metal ABC transporter solute-binding protein, Zn/Mn family [Rhodothermus marinus]|uniref:metal ABC transporter substrate-binding protein n=1 Tax=Rhodothermus marinus TaxID=29549 RepID=UPI001FB52DE3|nr:zinc ABC transporter substrate-binding protein [Rhodothermus marinus]